MIPIRPHQATREPRTARILPALAVLPFLVLLFIQGLPIGQPLVETRLMFEEEIFASTLEKVGSIGNSDSIWPALIRALAYALALINLSRGRTIRRAARVLGLQWPLVGLCFLVGMSSLWSPNTEKVLINFVHAVGVTAVAASAALWYENSPVALLRHTRLTLVANLAIQLGIVLLFPQYGIAADGRWQGAAGHSNSLGLLAFLCFWAVAATIFLEPQRRGRRLLFVQLGFCAFMLWGSASATSIISAGISAVAAAYLMPRASLVRSLLRGIAFPAGILLVAGALLAVLTDFSWASVFPTSVRSADFTGRTYLWVRATELIGARPWLGWGFDDNARVIAETGMPHTTYHNGYLDVLVRGGVLALLLLFISFFLNIARWTRCSRQWRLVAVSSTAALLVYNLTEVTFEAPRSAAWILMMVVFLACASNRRQTGGGGRFSD